MQTALPSVQAPSNILVPDDGTGDQLGEHDDVGAEIEKPAFRRNGPAVCVNEIGRGLEGVKADADGKRRRRKVVPKVQRTVDCRQEKAAVFVEKQDPEVIKHANGEQSLAPVLSQQESQNIIDCHRQKKQNQVFRVIPNPVGIEPQAEQK